MSFGEQQAPGLQLWILIIIFFQDDVHPLQEEKRIAYMCEMVIPYLILWWVLTAQNSLPRVIVFPLMIVLCVTARPSLAILKEGLMLLHGDNEQI
jgi:hypothetical protein